MRGNRYFYFALARELKMTVRDMLSKMDSREIAEWQAFFVMEQKTQKGESLDESLEDKIKRQMQIHKLGAPHGS